MDEDILDTVSSYFFELFESLPRGGPGNRESTLRAYGMMKDLPPNPRLLDIGCGPGQQTIDLAKGTDASITAFDLHTPFVEKLRKRILEEGVSGRIDARVGDMFKLAEDYEQESFDIIWSEGALYFMGFENALRECKKLLRPGGYLAVSEGCWFTDEVPEEAKGFWKDYDGAKTVEEDLEMIEGLGYEVVGHFSLPLEAWTVDFYGHMEKSLAELEKKYADSLEAMAVFADMREEIGMINKFHKYTGYGFFVLKKPE